MATENEIIKKMVHSTLIIAEQLLRMLNEARADTANQIFEELDEMKCKGNHKGSATYDNDKYMDVIHVEDYERVKKAFSESKVSKGVTMSESNRLDIISLSNVSIKSKILLLNEAGYGSDGTYVTKDKKIYLDPYTNKPVKISNMALLPGSVTVVDDNPFSLIEYLEEHNKEI